VRAKGSLKLARWDAETPQRLPAHPAAGNAARDLHRAGRIEAAKISGNPGEASIASPARPAEEPRYGRFCQYGDREIGEKYQAMEAERPQTVRTPKRV
jgi:hypothetical protein